jgi:hypothetical protein
MHAMLQQPCIMLMTQKGSMLEVLLGHHLIPMDVQWDRLWSETPLSILLDMLLDKVTATRHNKTTAAWCVIQSMYDTQIRI